MALQAALKAERDHQTIAPTVKTTARFATGAVANVLRSAVERQQRVRTANVPDGEDNQPALFL